MFVLYQCDPVVPIGFVLNILICCQMCLRVVHDGPYCNSLSIAGMCNNFFCKAVAEVPCGGLVCTVDAAREN